MRSCTNFQVDALSIALMVIVFIGAVQVNPVQQLTLVDEERKSGVEELLKRNDFE